MTYEEIKPFLGKKVKITFLDNESRSGTLSIESRCSNKYFILKERMLFFSADVVKKIEVLK